MPKLVEDLRVTTFSPNDTVRHDTFLNEIQDQLRGVLKARVITLINAQSDPGAARPWYYTADTVGPNPFWTCQSFGSPARLVMPVELREGEKITEIRTVIFGAAATTGGEIALYKQNKTQALVGSPWTLVVDIGGTNPWQYATRTEHSQTGLGIIIDIDTQYAILFTASSYVIPTTIDVIYTSIKAQFGN